MHRQRPQPTEADDLQKRAVEFGRVIRRQRREQEVALQDAAAAIEISLTYLAKIERGDVPPPPDPLIEKLAAQFRLERNMLFHKAGRLTPEARKTLARMPDVYEALLRSTEGLT